MPKRKQLVPRNVTKFNVPCAFGGQASEVAIFIGNPEAKHNPIHFQSKFISDVRGGVIPQSVLESLEKLQKLSTENGVPFEELCRYALSSMSENNQVNSEIPAPPIEAKDKDTISANSNNAVAAGQDSKENITQNNQVNSEIPALPTDAKDTVVEDNKITEASESEDKQTDMKDENR